MSPYARPDSLVTTAWVEEQIGDPEVLVVEVDVDPNAYEEAPARVHARPPSIA
jgi:hypothetical protein